jgi:hypothetical protein
MKTIKRIVRRILFLFLILAGLVILSFVFLRDEMVRFASETPLDVIQSAVVENLEDSEVAESVMEEFSLLKERVNDGRVTVEQIRDLVEEFHESYEDGELDEKEIKQIIARVNSLTR